MKNKLGIKPLPRSVGKIKTLDEILQRQKPLQDQILELRDEIKELKEQNDYFKFVINDLLKTKELYLKLTKLD